MEIGIAAIIGAFLGFYGRWMYNVGKKEAEEKYAKVIWKITKYTGYKCPVDEKGKIIEENVK